MAGPGICALCLVDTCTSEVHPVFNPVAPYGYLLSDMYLFMADIINPDSLYDITPLHTVPRMIPPVPSAYYFSCRS